MVNHFRELFSGLVGPSYGNHRESRRKFLGATAGGTAVVAVQTVFEGFASETREAVRELQLRYELAIPMGHDPGTPDGERFPSTMLNYRTGATPWTIVIEPGGTVAYNNYHIDGDKFIELLKKQLG